MINTHKKDLHQLLLEVKSTADLVSIINDHSYAKPYIEQAVNDKFILFDIIESELPVKIALHDSMAGAFLLTRNSWQIVFQVVLGEKVPKATRVKQLKALYDMVSTPESKILVAILKKNLAELYPLLTHEFICQALKDAEQK